MAAMGDLMALLQQAADGDRRAYDAAYAQVYPVLKRLARGQKRRAAPSDDANTTSIVNDACLRLMHSASPRDEAHFYAIAATAMRQILIDRARRRLADKHGGGAVTSLDGKDELIAGVPDLPHVDVLALDQVLSNLAKVDARLARLVEWRCFAELELAEIGRVMDISERTARREWRRARAYLLLHLEAPGQ
jgi:RNA polymerase sigma factor (TIGR02999 family)